MPRFCEVDYHADGTIARITPRRQKRRPKVLKTIVPVLPPPVTNFIIPLWNGPQPRPHRDYAAARGLPLLPRRHGHPAGARTPVAEIIAAMHQILASTGYEEIALLSLQRLHPRAGTHRSVSKRSLATWG